MSPRQITSATSLENLKREAKRWLRSLRENDPKARHRLERALAGGPPLAAPPTLRDVQHALAREFGLGGWTALRDRLAAAAPVPAEPNEIVHRFLDNACPDHHVRGPTDHVRAQATAMRLLQRYAGLAGATFQTAIVCGDLARVERTLRERPELASAPGEAPTTRRSGSGGEGDLYHDLGPKGWEPLLYLCFTRLPLPAVTDNAVAIARALLDHGADPNVYFMAGDSRYTPLVGVIGEGEEDRPPHQQREALTRLLLDRGAEPYDMQVMYNVGFHADEAWFMELAWQRAAQLGRKRDWDDPEWRMLDMGGYGSGARWHLEHAISRDNLPLAEWCLAHGANPNAKAPESRQFSQVSLYETAVARGREDIAELLVRHGARRTAIVLEPEQAFAAACLRMDRDEVRAQLARHAEFLRLALPMRAAARDDRVDVVEFLLELGVSPNVENAQKERPLHFAGYQGAVRMAELLIARGAEIDPVESHWHNTPLGAAAYARHRPVMDVLARYSRDIWELAYAGYVDRLRVVLAEEPARARVTWDGNTPLMWLPPHDESVAMEVAELFLSHGADPRPRTKDGMTAADRAEQNGMYEVAERLREAEEELADR